MARRRARGRGRRKRAPAPGIALQPPRIDTVKLHFTEAWSQHDDKKPFQYYSYECPLAPSAWVGIATLLKPYSFYRVTKVIVVVNPPDHTSTVWAAISNADSPKGHHKETLDGVYRELEDYIHKSRGVGTVARCARVFNNLPWCPVTTSTSRVTTVSIAGAYACPAMVSDTMDMWVSVDFEAYGTGYP